MYLLDTDLISIIQRRSQPQWARLDQRMLQHPGHLFYYSIVSFHEQVMGAHAFVNQARSPAELVRGYRMLEDVRATFAQAQVLLLDPAAVATFDQLRAQRVRISTMDLRIASIALVNNYTILTRNLSHFNRVPNLTAQDWTT